MSLTRLHMFTYQVLLVTGMILLLSFSAVAAPLPELIVQVNDTSVESGGEGSLEIYLTNYVDTVAGFNIWLQLDRPDLIEFPQGVDTLVDTLHWQCLQWEGPNCVESLLVDYNDPWDWITIDSTILEVAAIDTTQSLTSGWQYVQARSLGGMGYDNNIVGLANMIPPPVVPGIPPQEGGVLIRVPFVAYDIPDTTTDRTVNVIIQNDFLDHFSFATPSGQSIGIYWDSTCDSTFWRCVQWAGEVCLAWEQVSMPPYDSIEVVCDSFAALDTSLVWAIDGSVTVLYDCVAIPLPGDVDDNGILNVGDLTMMTDFIYYGDPPLPNPLNADVNGDCKINWSDMILLMEGGQFADCTCPNPIWFCCADDRGNVDYDSGDNTNIADLTSLVAYLFGGGSSPVCMDEANIDGTGPLSPNIADLTYLVAYLFAGGPQPGPCPE